MFTANATYGAVTVVYPTGVSPTDVENVQAAVNQGGTVLLKAVNQSGVAQSFNFGTWNASVNIPANSDVTLTTSVAITGEKVGSNTTTIVGGVVPFFDSLTAANITITGLKFVNPQGSAITVYRSSGLTILNNEIDGVLPFLNSSNFTESSGMYIVGVGNTTITGSVLIAGNYIHGLDGQQEYGIQVSGVESPITIESNTLDMGTATDAAAGQITSQGIAVLGSSGTALVALNNVSVGAGVCVDGIAIHGPSTGAATILGNDISIAESALCYDGIEVTGATGPTGVIGNTIDSENEEADGIALIGAGYLGGTVTGVTVAANTLNIENSIDGAIGLYGAVSQSVIALNCITGEAAYALSASGDGIPGDDCSSNAFLDNFIIGFTAADATVFFDTNTVGNVVVGPYTNDINNGTGNLLINLAIP